MRTSGTPEPYLLRVAAAADRLGVSPRVVYEWLATGVIPLEVR